MEGRRSHSHRTSTLPSSKPPILVNKTTPYNSLQRAKNQNEINNSLLLKICEINQKIAKILVECNNDKEDETLTIKNPNFLSRMEAKQICGNLIEMIDNKLNTEQSKSNESVFKNSMTSFGDKLQNKLYDFYNKYPCNSWNRTSFLVDRIKLNYPIQHSWFINLLSSNFFDMQHVPVEYYIPKTLLILIAEIFQHCHLIEATQDNIIKQIISILRFYLTSIQDIFLVFFKFKFPLPFVAGEYYRCSFPVDSSFLNFVEVVVECKVNSKDKKYIHATAFADNLFAIDLKLDCVIRTVHDSIFFSSKTHGTINMFRLFRSFEMNFPDILISDISSNPRVASIGNAYIKESQTSLQCIISWKINSKYIEDLEFKTVLMDCKSNIKTVIDGNFYHLNNIKSSGLTMDWKTTSLPNVLEIYDDSSNSSNLRSDKLWNGTIKFLMDNELPSARLQIMKNIKNKIKMSHHESSR